MKKLNDGITVFGNKFDGMTVFETPTNPPFLFIKNAAEKINDISGRKTTGL